MALMDMSDLLAHAREHRYAIGAFDLVSLDFLEAVIEAAEHCRSPVILSIEQSHLSHIDLELMMPAVETAARRTDIPVAIQIDHVSDLRSAIRAIRMGCNGIMVDASHEDLTTNIAITRDITGMAKSCGIPVAGELGYVAGAEGEGAQLHPGEASFTLPAEARAYTERTGVSFLSVSVGTIQGRQRGRVKLDIQRLKQIHETIDLPLMIHGGSGLNDDQYTKLTMNGVVKIDCFTALADVATRALRELTRGRKDIGFTDMKRGVKQAINTEVARYLKLWGSAGRAAEVMSRCRPWENVEHLIVFNAGPADEQKIDTMIREGKQALIEIPGVREVYAGEAIKTDAGYRFCWRIRFAGPAVIDSYRGHPLHTRFADSWFRPIATDRITTDYRAF